MRRSGRTTRIANDIIEMLFQGKAVVTEDHGGTTPANEYLVRILLHRLANEHKLYPNEGLIIERGKRGSINIKLDES